MFAILKKYNTSSALWNQNHIIEKCKVCTDKDSFGLHSQMCKRRCVFCFFNIFVIAMESNVADVFEHLIAVNI